MPLRSTSVPTMGNDPSGSPQQHHRHRRDGSGVAGGSHGTAGEAFPVNVPGFQLRGITSRQGNALLKRRRAPCWLGPEQSTAAGPRQPRLCSVIRAGHYPRRAPAAATTKRSQLTIPRVLFGAGAEHGPGPGGDFFLPRGQRGDALTSRPRGLSSYLVIPKGMSAGWHRAASARCNGFRERTDFHRYFLS